MELPKSVRFVVIGAGVHGLSTAYHLAKELKARGRGIGRGHPDRRQDAASRPARPGSRAASCATTTTSPR